ncbi:MAG: PadR family transcriptional regulator [Deltaproteobacteria bacterium]|nr:PadR family transcriptional regulator [Deltaproteobacteria bacterium]
MLSKITTLVLGLISEKPMNPYEIQKIIETAQMKKIYSMSSSSIYATIRMLKRNKYISGKKIKEGSMPEKTVYSATVKGNKILQKTLAYNMSEPENLFSEFDVSIVFLCHLRKEHALSELKKRFNKIESLITESEKELAKIERCNFPYTAVIRRNHYIDKRKVELKTIKELIKNIEKDNEWNHLPALEWTQWPKNISSSS